MHASATQVNTGLYQHLPSAAMQAEGSSTDSGSVPLVLSMPRPLVGGSFGGHYVGPRTADLYCELSLLCKQHEAVFASFSPTPVPLCCHVGIPTHKGLPPRIFIPSRDRRGKKLLVDPPQPRLPSRVSSPLSSTQPAAQQAAQQVLAKQRIRIVAGVPNQGRRRRQATGRCRSLSNVLPPCLQAVPSLPAGALGISMSEVGRTLSLLEQLCGLLAAPPATAAAVDRLFKLAEGLQATALRPNDLASNSAARDLGR